MSIIRGLAGVTLLWCSSGCDLFYSDTTAGLSRDITELRKIVKIDVPAESIKWEIFGTPEATGIAPVGRTDYLTLVAQAEVDDGSWFARLYGNPGRVWIAPESARDWLSPYFKALLIRSNADLSQQKKLQGVPGNGN